jgi:hypothetical protein
MLWKYFLFESKILVKNRKNWFLGIVIMLFFPLFVLYTNQTPAENLRDIKAAEANSNSILFKSFGDDLQEGSADEQAMYNILTRQSTLVNFQRFYIREGEVTEDYVANGLELTELRLEAHELGYPGVPEHFIISKDEILKEDAMLRFIQKEELELDSNKFLAEPHFVSALALLSGLPFVFFVLISGGEIIVYEQRHQTVMSGFPISFMNKINIKVFIHFIQTMLFLVLGLLLGHYFLSKEFGTGYLTDPIVIYKNGGYEAVIIFDYLLYALLALAVITLVVLYVSILLNILFKNAFANVLVGFSLFLVPNLLLVWGINFSVFHPIKYIDFSSVLSGDLAKELGNAQIDFWYSILWLVALCALLIGVLFVKNKLSYLQSGKLGKLA